MQLSPRHSPPHRCQRSHTRQRQQHTRRCRHLYLLRPPAAALQPHETEALRAFLHNTAPRTPLCLGRISTDTQSSSRGLAATQRLQPGQPAILLSPSYVLSAPTGKEQQWESDWLVPFERLHGPLPPVLVELLMLGDWQQRSGEDIDGTCKLVVLLLYVRRLAAVKTAAGQQSLWADWLRLLPPVDVESAPCGAWSSQELQLLQYEPARSCMAASNAAALRLCRWLLELLQSELPSLKLATSVEEVVQALFHVKTRCAEAPAGRCLSLLPMHDCINHADTPNCMLTQTSDGWHVVPATSTIAPGKELTISYRSQQPLSNLDLMLAWGFVGPPTPLDPVLPLAFRALPAIDLQLVATAAARVLLAAANSTNHKGEQRQQQQQQLRSQLLAAAAGLPLSGGLASGLKQQERLGVQLQADIMYTEAARLFTAYTELSLCPWLLSQHPANSQHNATEGPVDKAGFAH